MNKKEALIAMINGRKVVDTSKKEYHYFFFSEGKFLMNFGGHGVREAIMPENSVYEMLSVKKPMSRKGYITKANLENLKREKDGSIHFSQEKTKRSYSPVTISWEEVTE